MRIGRRVLIQAGMAALDGTVGGVMPAAQETREMYGLIGKMIATPGQRDALISTLLEGTADMPGCLSYIVARDPADVNAVWITEVWDSKGSHDASLALPSVKQAVAKGRPMIASFGDSVVTTPVGGHGLADTARR